MKRVVSVLLAVLLCLQVLPLTLFAEKAAAKTAVSTAAAPARTLQQNSIKTTSLENEEPPMRDLDDPDGGDDPEEPVMCTPVLRVWDEPSWGSNVTDKCTVVWRLSGELLEEPISVEAGTTLSYEVTPTDALAYYRDGVLYYRGVSGEVTLTEPEQVVDVYLILLGRVSLTLNNQDGADVRSDEGAGYEVTWYSLDGEDYVRIGEGLLSPVAEVGTTLYCDVSFSGVNAQLYPDAEKYPCEVQYYAVNYNTITFTSEDFASATVTVTGFEGADVTNKCTIEIKDRNNNVLQAPYTVPAGSWIRYTVTPKNVLKIGGVQYYKVTTGEVQLLSEDQAVNVELGMQGTVTVKFVDKKTGEEIPMDGDDGWSVQWYHNGYRDGSGDTSRMHDAGDEVSCYLSLRGKTSTNYYNPGTQYYTVGFGNRTEIIDANIRVPELAFYTVERRVSQSGYLDVNRTDNGYTFDFVSLNGEALVLDRDYVDTGYRVAFKPEYLSSLGCGTHVFTVHYKETTEEDNYDTQLTVTLTKGDLNEVVFQSRANTLLFPTFYYSGKPKTLHPLLYVGSWTNDQRMGMLREGVDYEITYENNINATTDDSLAKVIFTGIGDYEGSTMVKEFKIKPCEINTGYADFEVVPNWDWPYLYDGTPKDMTDVSVYSRGKLLTEGVDYEISYQTWKDMPETVSSRIGSPTETVEVPIVIQGIGNYTSQWNSQSDYGTKVQYRIMPHVEETVGGTLVLNPGSDHPISWTWQLDPDGLLTVSGEGEMPEFSASYWLGGDDPDHYYFYGWRHGYSDFVKRAVVTGNVTRIESSAFDGCTNLVEAILPESVEVIGGSAFGNCRSLKTVHAPDSIRLPESLHTVESAMYYGCFGINTYNLELHLPDNITSYGLNSVPSSNKLYCRYGTTTHETLKAMGASGTHIIEGYDDYAVAYRDNYNLGGTYTVEYYFGHGGEAMLPDFIDSITHYDIFGQAASLITKLTIPGNIRVLNGDAFRFLDNCTEVVIEPGAMESLIQGLLNGHPETLLTIPDTVTTMLNGDFSRTYYGTTVIVGEGSAALEWAIAQGYYPDDGSGYGKLYRVVKNVQPYITPLTASVPSDTQEDLTITRNDGEFTFDSLLLGETALTPGTDYSVDGTTVTLKASFLQTLEIGTHEITLHYTGLADGVAPIDPVFKLTVVSRCRPVLTVLNKDGQDVTALCDVVWKIGSTVLEEPFSVAEGALISYTVTPKDDLAVDGVQYYKAVTGEVRLTEAEQAVEVSLGQLGSYTVTPSFDGAPIPEGWTVRWFAKAGSGYYQLGIGDTSPLVDAGKTLYYDVLLSGENALDYVNLMKVQTNPVVFGNTAIDAALSASPTMYNVKFHLNGGTESVAGSCGAQSIQRNHALILPVAPVRRGYVFTGWSCNYDGLIHQPGERVVMKQNVYFYAQWVEMAPLTVAFDLDPVAGRVSLVGISDRGEEISMWGANLGTATELEPIPLSNGYRNDNTIASVLLMGEVDGVLTELARYDDDNGDLYDTEGTITLTKTGSWTAVTEIKADDMEVGIDFADMDKVYSDPSLPRSNYQRIPFLSNGTVTYYVRFSGVPGSEKENYTNHDWTKVYTLTLTDGVLHAAVDKVAPESWTGRVVYGDAAIPAKNATVTFTQSAYGLERSYSAVTDETGSFTVAGFPDVHTHISVNWGGRKAYEHGCERLSQDMLLTLNSVRVGWRVDFDGVFDESLRDKLLTWSQWSSPEIQFTSGGKFAIRWGTAFADSRSQALYNVDPDAVAWEISDRYGAIEPVSGTLTFTDGAAELEQTLTLQAGVLVHVSADVTCGAKLAWFDADGGFVGFSGVNLGLYSNDGRDWLCVCPNEDGGSYTVALLYNDVALADDVLLSDIPATWILNTWENVTLGKNEVVELEAFRVTEEMKDNARYATKPASTLSADQDCFTDVNDLLTFSGSIGLDAEMKNGKISSLLLLAKTHDTPTMQLQALVIDGRVYGPDDFSLGHGNYSLNLRGQEISLPCEYKLYCRPTTPEADVRFTMEVSGSYTYGAGHNINFYNQPVGTGTAYRPGSVIRTLSTYVCGDTVTVTGTAQRYEAVQIFDGEALIGSVNADYNGEWSLTTPLEGADPQYMTVHLLHSETASGTRSRELWLAHDPNGPELKRFTMAFDGDREIDVGASYTIHGSSVRDVIFKAAFAHPDKLDLMAGGTRLIFKYCCYNGQVGYLNATYVEAENVYTAAIPGDLGSAIFSAEVIYEPILSYPGVDKDLNMTADFPGSPDYVPETAISVDEDMASVYFDALAEIQENNEGKTADDSFAVSFAYGETVSGEAAGRLPEGASLSDFTDAAAAMSELGLNLAEIGVNYGTATAPLTRILQAGQIWLNERPEEASTGLFNHTIQFPSKEMLEDELDLLALSADAQYAMQADMNGTPVDARFLVFTDADVDAEELSGTYFITVQAICDERNGLFQIATTTVLTKDFTGFSETLTAAANEPTRGATRYNFELGHLPEWYNWAWDSLNTASGNLSAIFGLTNGGLDMLNAFPHLSSLCGKASGGLALVNQFTSTVNYMVDYNKDAKKYGDKIDMLKNSPCYKKAMQWLYEKGMDDPNFDDGNLYQDHCRLLDAMKNVDFSGNLSGLQKANFYVNSACNGLAMYGALGGPVSWGVGLGATFFGLAFGYLTDKQVEKEEAARKFLYNRFMSDCAELFTMYSHANKDDPDCREFSGSKSQENAPDVQQPPQTMKVCYDPSGTVFEAVIENPVEGATAQLFYAIDADGNLVREDLAGNVAQLVPASEVRDLIPDRDVQTTDENGRYAWFVPEGLWYVEVSCDGYESGSSNQDSAATVYSRQVGKNLLPVLPVQLNVNIPLVDRTAPYVTDALYTTDGVYITFSKYMDEDTVLKAGNYSVFLRHGGEGEPDEWDYTVEPVEQGHVPDNLPDAGKTYTRTVLLRIDELQEGDVVHWTVNGNVRSYAGTRLGDTYKASGPVGATATLDAPAFYVDGVEITDETGYVENGLALELRLPESASEIASAKIVYSLDGGESWKTYTDPMPLPNNVDVIAKVEAIGYVESETVSRSLILTSTLKHCFAGTVTTSSGVSADGLSLTLTGPNDYRKTIPVVQDGFAFFNLPNGSYTLTFAGSDHFEATSMTVEIADNSVIRSLRLTAAPCDWALTEWVWSTNTQVEAVFTCALDEAHVETVPATVTSERIPATCLAPEKLIFTATVSFAGETFTDTKTVELGEPDPDAHEPGEPVEENAFAPTCTDFGGYDTVVYCTLCGAEISREHTELVPLQHDWGEPTYVWAEDCSEITASRTCKNDASHIETEKGAITSEVTKEATIDAEGEITYTATFTNPAFTTQIKAVATPKLEKPDDGLPCDGGDTCPGNIFKDMPAKGHWAHDAIDWAIVHGITAGTSATTFSPNAGCTRAQVVTFLWRAAGEPEPTTANNPFKDVKEGTYYYKAVLWAAETGVTTGTSATAFSPETTCTRGQIVTFIWRYEGTPEATISVNPFHDVTAGAYYERAVLWASQTGVTAGTSATTFSPNDTCTREQIVTFLYRDLAE